jgi:hypothetical protein
MKEPVGRSSDSENHLSLRNADEAWRQGLVRDMQGIRLGGGGLGTISEYGDYPTIGGAGGGEDLDGIVAIQDTLGAEFGARKAMESDPEAGSMVTIPSSRQPSPATWTMSRDQEVPRSTSTGKTRRSVKHEEIKKASNKDVDSKPSSKEGRSSKINEANRHTDVAETLPKSSSSNPNHIDLMKIIGGEDQRTTFMIRNIPNKYTQQMLLDLINETHRGQYDFVYLRMDFR